MNESKQPKKDAFVELFKTKTGGMHPNDFKRNPNGFAKFLKDPELRTTWVEALLEKYQ